MKPNSRPESNSDKQRADSSRNSNQDNSPKALPSIFPQSHSPEQTSVPRADNSLNFGEQEESLNTGNEGAKRKSYPNQQLKYRFQARIMAALTGAAVMLPVLAVGTATYYFGSRVISRQEILLKRSELPALAEAELTQERQLLAMLLIGTGTTALLAGTLAALWVKRANSSNSAALATITRQSPDESEREEEPSSGENLLDYLSQPLEPAKILALAVEEAQKALKCDRVVVYSLNRDKYGEVIAESLSLGWTEALGITIQDPCFEARYLDKYRDGRVKALNNIYEADVTPCYLEQLEKLEVKANLVTPIPEREQLFGLLVAHHCATAHVWQPEEIDFLTGLAQKLGSALDKTKLLDDSKLLVKQTEEEVEWLAFLTDATRHIRQSLQPEDILNVAVEEVRRIIRCERVVVYSLDSESRGVVVAESVSPGWTRALGITIKDPCFEARYLEKYQEGRVSALDNIYESGMTSCYLEQLKKLEVKANLVTPIIIEGQIFGLLVAHQCSHPRAWQQLEIHWVTQVATQVGLGLERARLLAKSTQMQAQAETEAQWTQFFTDATRHIRQSLNQKDVLNVTVEEVRRVLNCQRVVVYSLNRERYGVVVAESVAPGWTRALGITIKDPCFEARYLDKYRDGRVRALDNIYEAGMTACYIEQLEKLEVKANLVTPILNEGKLFGLLVAHQCSSPRVWQQYEIRWLTQIATQVGLALDNAKLLRQLETASLPPKSLQANSTERPSVPQIKEEAQTPIEAEITSIENQNKFASASESKETRKLPEATLVNKAMKITPQQQGSKLSPNTRKAFKNLFVEANQQSEEIANLLKQMQTAKDSARAITVSLESLEEEELTAQNKQVKSNKITLNHNLVTLQATTIEAKTTIMQLGNSAQKLRQMGSSLARQIKQEITDDSSESSPNSLSSLAERVSPLTNRLTKQTVQIEALITGITREVKEVVNLLESDDEKIGAEIEPQPEIQPILPSTTAINNKLDDLTVKISQAVEQSQNLTFINQFILQVVTLANTSIGNE